jgi:hypothetical protein
MVRWSGALAPWIQVDTSCLFRFCAQDTLRTSCYETAEKAAGSIACNLGQSEIDRANHLSQGLPPSA